MGKGKSKIKLYIGHSLAANGSVSLDPSVIKKIIKKEALYVGSKHSKGKRHKDEIIMWNNQTNQYNMAMTYNNQTTPATSMPLTATVTTNATSTVGVINNLVGSGNIILTNTISGFSGSNTSFKKKGSTEYKKKIVSNQAQKLMFPLLEHFQLTLPELMDAASMWGSGWTVTGLHKHKTDIPITIEYKPRGVGNKYFISITLDNENINLSRSLTLSEAVTDTLKLIKLIGL